MGESDHRKIAAGVSAKRHEMCRDGYKVPWHLVKRARRRCARVYQRTGGVSCHQGQTW